MQELKFQAIPNKYELMKNQIQDKLIQKIYSYFNYQYFNYETISKNENCRVDEYQKYFQEYFISYLQDFKFITYRLVSTDQFSPELNVNAIFCVEKVCIIIENIDINSINDIFNEINKQKTAMIINYSSISINSNESIKEKQTKEEVKNFCKYFLTEIQKNEFIKLTIHPIIGYLIRRFFYPTEYFKDQTFFCFNSNIINREQDIKSILKNVLFSCDLDPIKLEKAFNEIKFEQQFNKQKFHEEDFIILREINISNQKASYYLVIHLESLYIFMMKKLHFPVYKTEKSHEIYFNDNFSHRCITRFYGFVEKYQQITGFIYEYMCNGSLASYISSNLDKNNEIFSMMTISRLYQGIEYLHSKKLIHRDLKPSNILIDNNYLPYISDFETIRHTKDFEGNGTENKKFTFNFGSELYSSPEQDKGGFISYPTDIYSFGLIIYFLFEKNDMLSFISKKNSQILQIHGVSQSISDLFEQCVRHNQSQRPNIEKIGDILIKEFNQFDYFENYLFNEQNDISKNDIIKFIFETRIIQKELEDEIDMYMKNIFLFQLFYAIKEKEGVSSAFTFFGDLLLKKKMYYNGSGIKKDYFKAKQYYEKAAHLNNSDGFYKIGNLYCDGLGVKQDFLIAKNFYEISAKSNNSKALNALGLLYYGGKGVGKNYIKSKLYFELSAKQNNSFALFNLGIQYLDGFGVKQDYAKSLKYFELSAELNNCCGLAYLGQAYLDGLGVEKDYLKARKYLELSLKQIKPINFKNLKSVYLNEYRNEQENRIFFINQIIFTSFKTSSSYNLLGIIYLNGFGIKQDYLIAKKYFEKAIKKTIPLHLLI